MTRILVTGASGLLGANLALQAHAQYEIVGVVNARPLRNAPFETVQADLLDFETIPDVFDQTKPEWVVNCAAIASLDEAEKQPELAQRINAELPGRLAAEAAGRNLRFLHVSTDAVFDGTKGDYDEEDAPAPLSVYGRTKRIAELAVKAAHPHVLIVRPNFFGWSIGGNRSLAEVFYNNLSQGKAMKGFTDRIFCPLLVTDLADVILELLTKNLRGLYHAVSSDSMSKYDFGVALAKRFGLDASLIESSTTADTGAPRAMNLSLRNSRLTKALGRRLPTIAQGIEKLFAQDRSGYRAALRSLAPEAVPAKG